MTENIIIALISGLVASLSPILIFIATERGRKDKLRESQQASYKEATDAIVLNILTVLKKLKMD